MKKTIARDEPWQGKAVTVSSQRMLGEWIHLVAPPKVGILHESPVSKLALEEFVSLRVEDVLEEDVHVVEVLVGDLL